MIREETQKVKEPKETKLLWTLDIVGYQVPVLEAQINMWGYYDVATRTIYLDKHITGGPIAQADTVLHEVAHAIDHTIMPATDRLAERQISVLSTVLVDTLRRNSEFRQYLWERLQ